MEIDKLLIKRIRKRIISLGAKLYPAPIDEFAIQKVLNRLEKLSYFGGKSAEILSFGLQVVAKKNARKREKSR